MIEKTIDGVLLLAPKELWIPEEIPSCCGPGKGVLAWVIPETMWGLRVSAACYVHDAMYETGEFELANQVFKENLRRLIAAGGGGPILKALRSARAQVYYLAVCSPWARQYVKR